MLNEIVGVPARFNGLLTRKFNIVGGAPAPQLTPEIGSCYNFDAQPEDAILRGEMLATGQMASAAVAANVTAVQLRNATPGILVVVEQILGNVQAAVNSVQIGCGFIATDMPGLPAAGAITYMDFRRAVNAGGGTATITPAAKLTNATAVTPPTLFPGNLAFFRSADTGIPFLYTRPVILALNSAVQVYTAVNTAMTVTFQWREVPIGQQEVGPF